MTSMRLTATMCLPRHLGHLVPSTAGLLSSSRPSLNHPALHDNGAPHLRRMTFHQ